MSPFRPLRSLVVTVILTACTLAGGPSATARQDDADDAVLRDYHSGNGLLNRGLYELAAEEYRKFLSEHGEHEKAPVARYGLAVSLFRMGRYDEAAEELTALCERTRFTYAAEVATILGQCHLARQRYGPAAEAFRRVLEQHGDHDLADDATAGLVEALHLAGKQEDAIAQSQTFVTRWPESPLLARVEFFRALAEMSLGQYAEAGERLEKLLHAEPNGQFVERASLLLAQCLHHEGRLDQAAAQYRDVLKQETSPYAADALYGLGLLLQQEGKLDATAKLLDRLLEEHRDSPLAPAARLQRGCVWFDQGQFDRASELFQQLAEDGGELQDQAAYWMAKCRLQQGHPDEAARTLAEAVDEFPDSALQPEMAYDRAIALLRGGDERAAVKALKEFRERFPEHALAAEALHLLAVTEHRQGHYDESRTHCRAFLERYPSHELVPSIAYLSAENDFLAGRYGDASEGFQRFLTGYPNDGQAPNAKYRLGMSLYRLERFDEARRWLAQSTAAAATNEAFRPALLAMGDIDFRRGEWKDAEGYLADYLGAGMGVPSADDALLKLGLSRQRQGRDREALQAYEQLIEHFEQSPHRLQAVFERGQALVALNEHEAAAQAFEQVLADGGDSRFAPYTLNHLASIAMQRRAFEDAAVLFDRAYRRAPDAAFKADVLFQRGAALMGARQFEEAEKVFRRFLDKYKSHARAPEARARLAITQSRQDRHSEALETIATAEQDSGGQLEPSLRSALRYEKAWCLRELGRVEQAADAYRELLEADPASDTTPHALLELATIEMEADRHDAAAKLLTQLQSLISAGEVAVPPEVREQATYRLGVCEFELGRLAEAVEQFDALVAEFPDSPLVASASVFGGEALFRMGKHRQAVTHLARVVERFDSDPGYAPSLLRLGESLAALQRWAPSEEAFGRYVEQFGDSEHAFQAWFGLGWARENQQRYDEAVDAYRRVVEQHQGPTAARAQFQIGECLFAKKQYDEAVRELLKVDILYAYPEWSAAALYEAGRCFEEMAKSVEARRQFKEVVEKYKDTRWAAMAAQRLAAMPGSSLPGR